VFPDDERVAVCEPSGKTDYGYVIESLVMTTQLPEPPADGRRYTEDVQIAYVICALRDLTNSDLFDEEYHFDDRDDGSVEISRLPGSDVELDSAQAASDSSKGALAWNIPLKGLRAGQRKLIVTQARFTHASWAQRVTQSNATSRHSHSFSRLTVDEDVVAYPNHHDYIGRLELVTLSKTPFRQNSTKNEQIRLINQQSSAEWKEPTQELPNFDRADLPDKNSTHAVKVAWTHVRQNTRVSLKVTRDLNAPPDPIKQAGTTLASSGGDFDDSKKSRLESAFVQAQARVNAWKSGASTNYFPLRELDDVKDLMLEWGRAFGQLQEARELLAGYARLRERTLQEPRTRKKLLSEMDKFLTRGVAAMH
jgi:hypothetical protein